MNARLSWSAYLTALYIAVASAVGLPMTFAQGEPNSTSSGLWASYVGEHALSDQWSLHLEGYATWVGPVKHPDFAFLRTGLRRSFGHRLSSLVAYSYFNHYSAGDELLSSEPEHRISQDIQWSHLLFSSSKERASLNYRVRHEERFLASGSSASNREWRFVQRTRFRAAALFPLRTKASGMPNYFNVYDEALINRVSRITPDLLNLNLTSTSLGWKIHPFVNLELGYLHQYNPRPAGALGTHNNVITVNLLSDAPFRARR